MKISNVILAAMVAVTGFAAHAGQGENAVVVDLQKGKIVEFEKAYAEFKKNVDSYNSFGALLGSAKRREGGWKIVMSKADMIATPGIVMTVLSGSTRGLLEVAPQIAVRVQPARFTKVAISAGAITVLATAVEVAGQFELNIAEGEKITAEKGLESASVALAQDRSNLEKLASDLGAKVTNHIITGLPEQLRQLGGSVSSLNLNQ